MHHLTIALILTLVLVTSDAHSRTDLPQDETHSPSIIDALILDSFGGQEAAKKQTAGILRLRPILHAPNFPLHFQKLAASGCEAFKEKGLCLAFLFGRVEDLPIAHLSSQHFNFIICPEQLKHCKTGKNIAYEEFSIASIYYNANKSQAFTCFSTNSPDLKGSVLNRCAVLKKTEESWQVTEYF